MKRNKLINRNLCVRIRYLFAFNICPDDGSVVQLVHSACGNCILHMLNIKVQFQFVDSAVS